MGIILSIILSIMGDFFEHCSKSIIGKNLNIIGWGLYVAKCWNKIFTASGTCDIS